MPSSETVWTTISLGVRTLVQAAVAALAATLLDPKSGGLWFIFASMGGIVQLLDMGLGVMILRAASQLQAGSAELTPTGISSQRTLGGQPNITALQDLQSTTGWVYVVMMVGVWILAGIVGALSLQEGLSQNHAWGAWGVFALGTSLQLLFSQKSNFLQGVGKLVRAQKLTAIGLIGSFGLAGVMMALTRSIFWASAMLIIGWGVAWVLAKWELRTYRGGHFNFDQLRALWPNSARTGIWRMAFACFYHLPVLLIAPIFGVELAGRYGFTVQVFLLLLAMAQIPIAGWLPKLNALALGPSETLCRTFCQRMRYQNRIYWACGIFLVVAGPWVLSQIGARTTLLSWPVLIFFLFHFFFETHRHSHVMITNAFNRLDFWKVDVASAVLLLAGGWLIMRVLPFDWYILWMGLVAWCGNFWVSVRHSLRAMDCSFGRYGKLLICGK